MAAHAEVVIAAPDRHVSPRVDRLGVVVPHGESGSAAVYRLKYPVRVIRLLVFNLLVKELIVLECDS